MSAKVIAISVCCFLVAFAIGRLSAPDHTADFDALLAQIDVQKDEIQHLRSSIAAQVSETGQRLIACSAEQAATQTALANARADLNLCAADLKTPD